MQVDWYPFRRKLRLCAALLVAAVFTNPFSASAWRKVWGAVTLWFDYTLDPHLAPDDLYEARFAECRVCPLFYSPLKTCGSPLRKDLRGLGCYCNMETKAKMLYGDCWYRLNSGDADLGWPDSLRRFEREPWPGPAAEPGEDRDGGDGSGNRS